MHAKTKLHNLDTVRRLYYLHPDGLSDLELSALTGINPRAIHRYRTQDFAGQVVETQYSKYTMRPTQAEQDLATAINYAVDKARAKERQTPHDNA